MTSELIIEWCQLLALVAAVLWWFVPLPRCLHVVREAMFDLLFPR